MGHAVSHCMGWSGEPVQIGGGLVSAQDCFGEKYCGPRSQKLENCDIITHNA